MKEIQISKIKRMLYIEDLINKLRISYPEIESLNKEKKLLFFSKKISKEIRENLTIEDWEYFNVACIIPLNELQKDLENYDNSSPKMDEIKFINDLSQKYNVDKSIIIARIKQVRKITKFIQKEQSQKFEILAVPCKRAFVVDSDKTKVFLNVKPDPEIRRQQEEMTKIFRKNILIEEEPKTKKIGQKTDKK